MPKTTPLMLYLVFQVILPSLLPAQQEPAFVGELRARMRRDPLRFVELKPNTDPAAIRYEELLFLEPPLVIGDTTLRCFRFHTPKEPSDLVWAFGATKGRVKQWFIVDPDGPAAGFTGYDRFYPPPSNNEMVCQDLPRAKLKPDHDYLIWFSTKPGELLHVLVSLNLFAQGGATADTMKVEGGEFARCVHRGVHGLVSPLAFTIAVAGHVDGAWQVCRARGLPMHKGEYETVADYAARRKAVAEELEPALDGYYAGAGKTLQFALDATIERYDAEGQVAVVHAPFPHHFDVRTVGFSPGPFGGTGVTGFELDFGKHPFPIPLQKARELDILHRPSVVSFTYELTTFRQGRAQMIMKDGEDAQLSMPLADRLGGGMRGDHIVLPHHPAVALRRIEWLFLREGGLEKVYEVNDIPDAYEKGARWLNFHK